MKSAMRLWITIVALAIEPVAFGQFPVMMPYQTTNSTEWWTNPITPSVISVPQLAATVNTNFTWVAEQLGALPDAQTNAVLNSFKVPGWSTNSLSSTYGTTNAVGWFTNWAGATFTTLQGSPVLIYSFNGTNWSEGAQTLLTTNPVNIAMVDQDTWSQMSGMGSTPMTQILTNLQTYVLQRPDLLGRTNAQYGQSFRVGQAVQSDEAVPLGQVQSLVAATPWWSAANDVQLNGHILNHSTTWQTRTDTTVTNQDLVRLQWLDTDVFTWTAPAPSFGSIAKVWVAGTNINVAVVTNGVATQPSLQFTHTLSVLNWGWQALLSNSYPASVTVAGKCTNAFLLTFPMQFTDQCYFRAAFASTLPTVTTCAGVLRLAFGTVTNATDTTWGFGAGLIRVDSNYVVVSVGTNLWKRAALSSW